MAAGKVLLGRAGDDDAADGGVDLPASLLSVGVQDVSRGFALVPRLVPAGQISQGGGLLPRPDPRRTRLANVLIGPARVCPESFNPRARSVSAGLIVLVVEVR